MLDELTSSYGEKEQQYHNNVIRTNVTLQKLIPKIICSHECHIFTCCTNNKMICEY